MKFPILNRWSGRVQFEAEIDCSDDAAVGIKVGLAVKWARKSGAVLSGAVLRGAVLSDADLSGAVLRGAVLSGAVLSGADLRGAVLSGAVLSGAVLSGADLRGAVLSGAVLRGAVLSDADLSGAVLRGADLSDAVLSGADLSDADLRGAVLSDAVLSDADLGGVPVIPNIHQAVYAAAAAPKALDMSRWHTCDTTHCRAGWVTTLAGEAGKSLEDRIGTHAAATLIYLVSDPGLERVPSFYATDAVALADMKRLAEAEAAKTAEPA